MKKTLFLILLFVLVCANVQAQSSEVETSTQITKAEQFKLKNSFIKETQIYEYAGSGVKILVKLLKNLKNGEEIAALEFYQSALKLTGVPLGYLDMDSVDDLLLALETIQNESNNSTKKEKISISYSAPGGIDVFYTPDFPGQMGGYIILFRKKWFAVDDYGMQTCNYSETIAITPPKELPKLISSIKEAQMIANQALGK